MYKIYFKQAVQMLKQNKFISTISILGTALAIMMIMVIIVTQSIKNASIAPESNRNRTYYIRSFTKVNTKENGMWASSLPYDMYKEYLSDLKTPEYATLVDASWYGNNFMVKNADSEERELIPVKKVDASYWQIMSFSFLDGKPFSKEDFESGIRNTVITESLANKVFGKNNPLGKNIEIDFKDYKVIGIIKDVPQTFTYAYAQAYVPYTSKTGFEKNQYNLLCMLKDETDLEALDSEIRTAERKFGSVNPDFSLTFFGPYNLRQISIQKWMNETPNEKAANKKMLFIFIILLLIPAINLSGFSMSRMKRRMEEIGVRKAFGAKRYIILIQVLYENFITSIAGGIIGLVLSYMVIYQLKNWLLGVDINSAIPIQALISFPVFLSVFMVCFLLNLISAAIPAYQASKISIANSLNNKID